jgi:hypothetical protein
MRRREKILAVTLLVAIVLWQGGPFVSRAILEPIDMRQAELDRLAHSIALKQEEQVRLTRTQQRLADWQDRRLSHDPLVAQRLYQQWLTDLAQEAGFTQLKVTPERRMSRNETYTAVEVSVSGEATLQQLCLFLYRFARTDRLHRVSNLNISRKKDPGDPQLKVDLTAEGLALLATPPRDRLFPEARLAKSIGDKDDVVAVRDYVGIPTPGASLLRIGGEYLDVTSSSGDQLTVRRGSDGSPPAAHNAGERIEAVPVHAEAQKRSAAAYEALLARNPFAVPAPEEEPSDVAEGPSPEPLDPAKFTYLTGTMLRGDDRKALFYDRLNNERAVVAEGESFSIAGFEAVLLGIRDDHVLMKKDDRRWRLDIGGHLRSVQPVDDPP